MGDAFQCVLNGVGKVVHGVDAPLGPLAVMLHMADAVQHRVPHVEVAGGQVDLGPEGVPVVREFPGPHPAEQVQRLFCRPVPVGGDGGVGQVAPVLPELLRSQLADVSQALGDELLGKGIGFFKVVRAVEEPVAPVKAQPVDVLLNGVYVLRVFLGGVGVIHPQVADAAKLFRRTEVNDEGFAVANVEVPIGLRGETGVNLVFGKLSALP